MRKAKPNPKLSLPFAAEPVDQYFWLASTLGRYCHFLKSLILIYGTAPCSHFTFNGWLTEENQMKYVERERERDRKMTLNKSFLLN